VPAVEAAPHLELSGLGKSFGKTRAVVDFSLSVPRGSFTTLLGPSGCGKTTVLRMVGGFVEPDAGSVRLSGVDQVGRPPNLRGVGMVFQDYALFPHMNVRANVEYGLRMHRFERKVRDERVARSLELLDLTHLAARFPHELSGGQQQRVALGRALVLEPEVLLMDEPFSNLDAKLRVRLRAELKALQRQLGITTLYVTHDQEEALSLSDSVVVMDHGRQQQVGTPESVYRRPANRFVAEFVGHANLTRVTAAAAAEDARALAALAAGRPLTLRLPDERRPAPGTAGLAMVRPEHVRLLPAGVGGEAGEWRAPATVVARGFFGSFERYWVTLEGEETPWLVDMPLGATGESGAGGGADTGTDTGTGAGTGRAGGREPGANVTVALTPEAACWVWLD